MHVWEMTNVSDKFLSLILKEQKEENYSYLFEKFEGKRIENPWFPPSVKYLKKRANKSDAPKCWDIKAPIFSERAVRALSIFLDSTSQILPLEHETEKYYAINVLNIVDALDKQKSKIKYFSSGRIMEIEEYFFNCDKLKDQHIFKIPEMLKIKV